VAVAAAESIRATIGKKTLRAPFAGRLGIRLVNLGQILKEGDPVVSLQTLDPIFSTSSCRSSSWPRSAPVAGAGDRCLARSGVRDPSTINRS
jgi:hypothetical protein